MADARPETKNDAKKGCFLSRMLKRVAKLAVLAAVGAAIALVAGFKLQKEVVYKVDAKDATTGAVTTRTHTIPCGRWAWEDTEGFKRYAGYWVGRTRETGADLASKAKELDKQYGVTDKAKQAIDTGVKKVGEGAEAVKEKLQEQLGDKQPASAGAGPQAAKPAEDFAAQRDKNLGYTDAEAAKLPAGFLDALRSGDAAYEAARRTYERSHEGTPGSEARKREALTLFQEAFAHYEKAIGLNPLDERAKTDLIRIQEYMEDLSKSLGATSTH